VLLNASKSEPAQAMGADFAYVGSAFISTEEATDWSGTDSLRLM
jgi:NAD(P)H-dependent flavin oxidoreductase YrpB (nitropropane dioxygenase family)